MKAYPKHSQKITSIGLGGGCHWCTEAVYASLKGVTSVEQGWISSNAPNDAFSEAVLIGMNEKEISLYDVIEIHLYTHSATSNHAMRKKYRSAIYTMTQRDKKRVEQVLKKLAKNYSAPLITQALLFKEFKRSEEVYLAYYYKSPDKPFCQTYIQPKLEKLM